MWSKTKQALESRLAEGLKGRVAYNYAVYRMDGKCPTECQVLSILVDGESRIGTARHHPGRKSRLRRGNQVAGRYSHRSCGKQQEGMEEQ